MLFFHSTGDSTVPYGWMVATRDHAQQAGVRDPEAVGYQMQILMIGAIVAATRGDLDAARRAREVAELILDKAR